MNEVKARGTPTGDGPREPGDRDPDQDSDTVSNGEAPLVFCVASWAGVSGLVLVVVDGGVRAGEDQTFVAVLPTDDVRRLTVLAAHLELQVEEIDTAEMERVATEFGRVLGRKLILKNRVVPELIGGARVIAGNRMLDGSVSGRLEALRRRLQEVPLSS